MNYQETLDFLYNQLPMYQRQGVAAIKKDLGNIKTLCQALNNPHNSFDSIHIAGTNGKGSVAHMLASVFKEQGLKVGLYTSPHYIDFRERIKINGEWIPQAQVVEFVDQFKSMELNLNPSFFEFSVAMAFNHFQKNKVDLAIVETGLGGRLDSTNILTPILSVITNVSLDHQQFLGNDLKSIAFEKAGIIKKDVPVVIGEYSSATHSIFSKIASERNATLIYASQNYTPQFKSRDLNHSFADISKKDEIIFDDLEIPLYAEYQWKNIITSISVFDVWNQIKTNRISNQNIRSGFKNLVKNSNYIYRSNFIEGQPLIIWDSAHNEEGVKALVKELNRLQVDQLHIVLSFVSDKNLEAILSLLPVDAEYYFTKAQIPRAMDPILLQSISSEFQLSGNIYEEASLAFLSAKSNASKSDAILICGSIFTIGELLQKGLASRSISTKKSSKRT